MSSTASSQAAQLRHESRAAIAKAIGSGLLTFATTMLTVLVIWWGGIKAFNINPYVAKSPGDVWTFLVTDAEAGANRSLVVDALGTTLVHALMGLLAGLAVAIAMAIAFTLSKTLESTLMPPSMLLRSVPLVALAPVIIVIFGYGSVTATIIGVIVVLFPALVTIMTGLKSASPMLQDVVSVYGGTSATTMKKVQLPSALPSLFAAARVSVPGAMTGALLAEWLATGNGIGGMINKAYPQAQFALMWAGVVVVTVVALVGYSLVQTIENAVLARMGMTRN